MRKKVLYSHIYLKDAKFILYVCYMLFPTLVIFQISLMYVLNSTENDQCLLSINYLK